MQAEQAIAHALQHGKQLAGFCKQMHDWFDGFRTLKFLHAVRDQYFPSIRLDDPVLIQLLPRFENEALVALHTSTLKQGKAPTLLNC